MDLDKIWLPIDLLSLSGSASRMASTAPRLVTSIGLLAKNKSLADSLHKHSIGWIRITVIKQASITLCAQLTNQTGKMNRKQMDTLDSDQTCMVSPLASWISYQTSISTCPKSSFYRRCLSLRPVSQQPCWSASDDGHRKF